MEYVEFLYGLYLQIEEIGIKWFSDNFIKKKIKLVF